MTKTVRDPVKIVLILLICISLTACTNSLPGSDQTAGDSSTPTPSPIDTPTVSLPAAPEPIRWFENELNVSKKDLEDIKYIETRRQNPLPRYLYMSKGASSAAIAFTDGRVIDFGGYSGEIVGDAIVSFDERLVCRLAVSAEAYREDVFAPFSNIHASLDGGPLKLITKDYTQFVVLEHKNQIFYVRETPDDSGLFYWSEGTETRILSGASKFVCSANGSYVLVKTPEALYRIEVDSLAAVELTGIAPDAFEVLRPIGISNDGNYFYYGYGREYKDRTVVCAQLDHESGETKILGEATGRMNMEVVFNYDGTQAVIDIGRNYWAFSPGQGLKKIDNMPKGIFARPFEINNNQTNENDFTYINQNFIEADNDEVPASDLSSIYFDIDVYTCAVANIDDVLASMINPPQDMDQKKWSRIYYDRTASRGMYYSDETLYEFEIVNDVASTGHAFATNVVDFKASVDNTKMYYLMDTSDSISSSNGVSKAQLWYKESGRKPVLVAEDVCYAANDAERNLSYAMYIDVSPDGSKVTFIIDFDLPTKLGKLMVVDNLGQPEILSQQATSPLRIDNDGNVLLIKHSQYVTGWTMLYNFYNVYLYNGEKEILLDKDISLAWYT